MAPFPIGWHLFSQIIQLKKEESAFQIIQLSNSRLTSQLKFTMIKNIFSREYRRSVLITGRFHICKFACMLSRFSRVQLFVTLWTVARQAPLSIGFSMQYWSGLPCPPPGDLPDPGIKPISLLSPALTGRFFSTSATWEAMIGG